MGNRNIFCYVNPIEKVNGTFVRKERKKKKNDNSTQRMALIGSRILIYYCCRIEMINFHMNSWIPFTMENYFYFIFGKFVTREFLKKEA